VETKDEGLSMSILESIYAELQSFYIEDKIGGPQKAFDLLEAEVDSLFQVLNDAERRLAYDRDRNRGVASSFAQINLSKLERDVNKINQEYEQALSSKRRLEVLLQGGTPTFQVIDQTFFPIVNSSSKFRALILGGLVGLFVSTICVLFRKIVKDALKS